MESKTILLIEDEEVLADLLEKKLNREGYDVHLAEDGEVGLQKMRELKPDLVLLDIVMPKVGGFEVMEKASQDEMLKDIKIMVVSNSGQPVELEKAKEMGAVDWLIKTDFDPQEVIDKVKTHI